MNTELPPTYVERVEAKVGPTATMLIFVPFFALYVVGFLLGIIGIGYRSAMEKLGS